MALDPVVVRFPGWSAETAVLRRRPDPARRAGEGSTSAAETHGPDRVTIRLLRASARESSPGAEEVQEVWPLATPGDAWRRLATGNSRSATQTGLGEASRRRINLGSGDARPGSVTIRLLRASARANLRQVQEEVQEVWPLATPCDAWRQETAGLRRRPDPARRAGEESISAAETRRPGSRRDPAAPCIRSRESSPGARGHERLEVGSVSSGCRARTWRGRKGERESQQGPPTGSSAGSLPLSLCPFLPDRFLPVRRHLVDHRSLPQRGAHRVGGGR